MSPCSTIPDKLQESIERCDTSYGTNQWQRWDEDLVDEFGRWLGRIAKAFGVVLVLGSALIAAGWFWNRF